MMKYIVYNYMVDIVIGCQLGDEGKGKILDYISNNYSKIKYSVICKANGGGNSGHTVKVNNFTYIFHQIPSGILNPNCICIIGSGCVVNLNDLFYEIDIIKKVNPNNKNLLNFESRLFISDRAHILLDIYKQADTFFEDLKGANSIGTTKQGIAYCYSQQKLRSGIRICDLLIDYNSLNFKLTQLYSEYKFLFTKNMTNVISDLTNIYLSYGNILKKNIINLPYYINFFLKENIKILIEGSQSIMLDIDYGLYPFCTSSTCTINGLLNGISIPPNINCNVIYCIKSYLTRVGNGHFPTELFNDEGEKLQRIGHEFGSTTGRKRRVGWLDIFMINYSIMINGPGCIFISKLDVLDTFDKIKLCINYENENNNEIKEFPSDINKLKNYKPIYKIYDGWLTDTSKCKTFDELPNNAKIYINNIEKLLKTIVKYIGVGPERSQLIIK